MGCKPSAPAIEKVANEPVPDYHIAQAKISALPGEPTLTSGDDNHTNPDNAESLIFRQIGGSNKGDTFQLETYEDTLFHNLQIHPAKPGIGIQKRLEDLVFLHYENQEEFQNQVALGFAVKSPSKGLNHYLILSPTPMREGQAPVKSIDGPVFCHQMYPFASIEFDLQRNVANVRIAGQGKEDPPLYTLHQCNEKVWVVKKRNDVCAAIDSARGMGRSFTCYRVLVCAGANPALMSLLTHCIDSFLVTAKKQFWTFYDKKAASVASQKQIDWPPLDTKTKEKLFGRGGP
eukprot:CAMPEP_0172464096 /NCGR_PEP_ID=MMETSP1065-20121228/49350_1 /TAXON_ID=265537 /ORGANISM="Amphiprora paludosa, Strain CCMP125" /LENGTH=288 /DNA_ID=CAMNT_0013220237 /DNA_START=62 /DNA_END=929 /DNA_ORIENTATION=+